MIQEVRIADWGGLETTSTDPFRHQVIVSEYAGRLHLRLTSGKAEAEVNFEDLKRAWQAVRP